MEDLFTYDTFWSVVLIGWFIICILSACEPL